MKARGSPGASSTRNVSWHCLVIFALALFLDAGMSPVAFADYPEIDHVFLFVFENKGLREIVGSPDAPFINRLSAHHVLFTDYHAMAHPSLPNYVALISGRTGTTYSDDPELRYSFPTVVEAMVRNGVSVRGYFQSMPSPGFLGAEYPAGKPLYVLKHNPFFLFGRMRDDRDWQRRIVPLDRLSDDLMSGHIARFSFVIGDLCHDMHGGVACPANSKAALIRAGDRFLETWVDKIRKSEVWNGRNVIFITWDEGRYTFVQRVKSAIKKKRGWGGRVPFLAVKSFNEDPARVTDYEDHRTFVDTLGALFKVNYPGEPLHPVLFPERLFR